MITIHKHALPINEKITIRCIAPLSVIEQDGQVMLYTLQNAHNNKPHKLLVVGTGCDLGDSLEYMQFLGTVKCGEHVWHTFYRRLGAV